LRLEHFERSYGPSTEETLEILPTSRSGAPVLLFVHGGRWLPQPDNAFVYFADTLVDAGIHFAAARFATLAEKPGKFRLPDMIGQLRRAVIWLQRNAASFGGDPNRIHVMGHSSGGHLTSVLLTTDWRKLGAPEDIIKGGICVSGIYDLRPVMLSARSRYVQLGKDEEDELSAIRHLDRVRAPILVAYGDKESPEFQRQGKSFAAALKESRHPSAALMMAGCNHFEGVASMIDPRSPLAQEVIRRVVRG
jgi:arylformamidase